MYLKLQRGTMEGQMLEINKLILRIFEYLSTAGRLNRKSFEKALGTDGKWLMRYYKGLSSKLTGLMKEPLAERQKIYQALKKDMQFESYININSFCFLEKNLSEEQLNKVKDLIVHLYEQLFYKGKTQALGVSFSYHDFKEGLFVNNTELVCPACLGYRDNLKETGEVDHYLPKAKYPALTFHPINLAVICDECNGTSIKGECDPLENADLTEVYLPYLRAAEDETQLAVVGVGGMRKMVMLPRYPSHKVEKRIENLDKLFHLSKRWTKRMENCFEKEMIYLKVLDSEIEVEQELISVARKQKLQAATRKDILVDAACMEFLCGRGKDAVIDEWKRRKEEKRKMVQQGN